jgi:sialic acid synthase SpsE
MSCIILDFGSGNTCKNDKSIVKRMYTELRRIDNKKHYIIIKWQLFKEAGDNIPLDQDIFDYTYKYGTELGYEITASVFDKESLNFLSLYPVRYIKIANNVKSYKLIDSISCDRELFISSDKFDSVETHFNCHKLCCISKYPASLENYLDAFCKSDLKRGISDHTSNFELFFRYNPLFIEWHYKLEDTEGPDSGSFARTPEQLSLIL